MANYSTQSRKNQVLARLKAAHGGWVDGPDLANEECGGSEGLRRLRELVEEDGFNVRKRKHPDPDRDIWQYRLVPQLLDIPVDDEDGIADLLEGKATVNDVRRSAMLEPSEPPVYPKPTPPVTTERISTAIKRKEDGTFEYVPPQRPLVEQLTTPEDPPQPEGAAFDSMPTKLRWGEMAVCPRCRMKTTRGRPRKERAAALTAEQARKRDVADRRKKEGETDGLMDAAGVLLYRDPYATKSIPCRRCNGYGIVPNQGPIPMTLPNG